MTTLLAVFLFTGFYPLTAAWLGGKGSTVRHPLVWWGVAWAACCFLLPWDPSPAGRYFCLSMAACAGVAVLGARRPGAAAWHFVVVGLLATLNLPLLMGMGKLRLHAEPALFLGACLGVGVGNYLPTRRGLAAALVGGWAGLEMLDLTGTAELGRGGAAFLLGLSPWAGWWASGRREEVSGFGRRWRAFRDGFGYLWAQRVREQFNRAAENRGLQVELGWDGLAGEVDAGRQEQAGELLDAILQRFEDRPNGRTPRAPGQAREEPSGSS